jgi:hypothetical protein
VSACLTVCILPFTLGRELGFHSAPSFAHVNIPKSQSGSAVRWERPMWAARRERVWGVVHCPFLSFDDVGEGKGGGEINEYTRRFGELRSGEFVEK